MSYAVSIDPGVRDCGVAVWQDKLLQNATLVRCVKGSPSIALVSHVVLHVRRFTKDLGAVVIERPQVYTQNKLKGDPNDLITLAIVVGQLTQALYTAFRGMPQLLVWRPADWKGQLPKNVSIERTQCRISESERERVQLPKAVSLQHNVWDAVGIGLRYYGR